MADKTHTLATTRRTILGTALALPAATHIGAAFGNAAPYFAHGVASGDPLQDRVILWTRITPASPDTKSVTLDWTVAKDADFTAIVAKGQVTATADRDFTAKVDAAGLKPGSTYYYRFAADGVTSPVGRTKTLPETASELRLGLVSCSNYPQGFFNVYRALADRPVDVVLHLGDYIYEYAAGTYADPAMIAAGRQVQPAHECVELDDYRTRYSQYRGDRDLQAAHAAHPFICTWDDHEIANDSYVTGAENHSPDSEGAYSDRRAAAIRAYMEWMPIRESEAAAQGAIYRSFDFGGLATLIMLETRVMGRSKQLSYREDMPPRALPFDMGDPANPVPLLSPDAVAAADPATIQHIPVPFDMRSGTPVPVTDLAYVQSLDPKALPDGLMLLPDLEGFARDVLNAPDRAMLGAAQERWLADEVNRSVKAGTPWQILGQQLLMGKVTVPDMRADDIDFETSKFISRETFQFFQVLAKAKLPLNLDAWDGYPAARERVFDIMRSAGAHPLVVAGDTHNAWAFDLQDAGGNAIGVEIGTPGVSSPGLETYLPIPSEVLETALIQASPEMRYVDARHRGWSELRLTAEAADVEWFFVKTVKDRSTDIAHRHTAHIPRADRKLAT